MYKYDKGKFVKTDDTDQTIGVNNSLVRSANVNSNENSTVSAASLTKSGSSDEFKFNPAMEQRIKAAKDRQNMRQQAKVNRLSGGDEVKSQFVPTAKPGSKLYEKNLKLQNKLNKKFPQPVSTGGSSVAKSNINNTPASVISNVSGTNSIKTQNAITSSLESFSEPGTKSIDVLKRIKDTEPGMSDEKANKILKEYERYTPGEYTVKEVVGAYNRTRKFQ